MVGPSLKRRGFLGVLLACLPLLLARRSVAARAAVTVASPARPPLRYPGSLPCSLPVQGRRRHWCLTCAMLADEANLIQAAPDCERLPLPENAQDGGPFSPEWMAAWREKRRAESAERARGRARMICEAG